MTEMVPVSMMERMEAFSLYMLDAVSHFLGSEPVFYLFSLVCFMFVVKLFKELLF